MAENHCQICDEGTHYDAEKHECQQDKATTEFNMDTSLEKQLANIFSHQNMKHRNLKTRSE